MMNTVFSMPTKRAAQQLMGAVMLILPSAAAWAQVTVLQNATVHPISAPAIEQAQVVMADGKIVDVGVDLDVPADATVIDLTGHHLYPGFVHPATQLGLTEISSVAGTVDTREMGQINAALNVEVAVNHDSELLPASIAGGILTAHIIPGGGLIQGHSAVMNLDGWSWEEMLIASQAGQHIAFPPGAVDDEDNEDLSRINSVLDQARHWHQADAAASAGNGERPPRNDQLQALGPLLAGETPLMLHANRYDVMEAALDWADTQGFDNVVLVATPDVQHIASRLADADIPVILKNVYALPMRRHDGYDASFKAPRVLAEAGVKFAIADATRGMDVANARNLPFQAGSAVAHGLDPDIAMKAVTLWPAEILGVGDQLGSLEPGKRATLFAANGHPLEPMTQITHVWIDGARYALSDVKARRLYDRYRQRHPGDESP